MKRMITGTNVIGLLFLSDVIVYVHASSPAQRISDDRVYNEMVTITGVVTILNHPKLGITPHSHAYLVFQRQGCKLCLIATHTDIDGRYKIVVGRGRYKVIHYNPAPPTYDLLSPDQPRIVEANSTLRDIIFDIKVVLPKIN